MFARDPQPTVSAATPEPTTLGPAAAGLRTEVAAHAASTAANKAAQRNRMEPAGKKEKKDPSFLYRAMAPSPGSRPPWSGFTVTPEIETWPPMQWQAERIEEDDELL